MKRLIDKCTYGDILEHLDDDPLRRMSPPLYPCPVCNRYAMKNGGWMRRNEALIFTSNPPKTQFVCDICGHTEYHTG